MSLNTNIGGIELDNCICNGSGALCKDRDELINLNNSRTGAVITKTSTKDLRVGNPEPRYFDNEMLSINSMGLPNNGLQFYLESAKSITAKPYIVSISGFYIDEEPSLITYIQNKYPHVTGLELNMSCPNLVGKPQIAYDFEQFDNILTKIYEVNDCSIPIGLKLPPYFDMMHFDEATEIINKYPINFLTCINGLGNGMYVDLENESTIIKPKNGFGGIGGPCVKPIGLANTHQFYTKTKCDIFGCGGVSTGSDAFEYILCGASGVQVATQLVKEGTDCFSRINCELKQIMINKNYECLDDFKGKLNYIN